MMMIHIMLCCPSMEISPKRLIRSCKTLFGLLDLEIITQKDEIKVQDHLGFVQRDQDLFFFQAKLGLKYVQIVGQAQTYESNIGIQRLGHKIGQNGPILTIVWTCTNFRMDWWVLVSNDVVGSWFGWVQGLNEKGTKIRCKKKENVGKKRGEKQRKKKREKKRNQTSKVRVPQ